MACPESGRSAHASPHQRPASANTSTRPAGQEKPSLRGAAHALHEEGATLQILSSGSLCRLLLQYFHTCALVTRRPDFVALPVTSSLGLLACKHLLLLFVLSQKVLRCDENRRFPGCCPAAQGSHTDGSGRPPAAELLGDGLWLPCAGGRGQLVIPGCSSALGARVDGPASNPAFVRLRLGLVSK